MKDFVRAAKLGGSSSFLSFSLFNKEWKGVVWLTYDDPDLAQLHTIASYLFLAIATAIWPIYLPWSLYVLEKKSNRKKMIAYVGGLGGIIAAIGIYYLLQEGAASDVDCNQISYYLFFKHYGDVFSRFSPSVLHYCGYIFAVTAPFLISTIKGTRAIGYCIGSSVIVAQIFYSRAFGSVWCFFGALASTLIYFVIRHLPDQK